MSSEYNGSGREIGSEAKCLKLSLKDAPEGWTKCIFCSKDCKIDVFRLYAEQNPDFLPCDHLCDLPWTTFVISRVTTFVISRVTTYVVTCVITLVVTCVITLVVTCVITLVCEEQIFCSK
jgi:hypothetical protein